MTHSEISFVIFGHFWIIQYDEKGDNVHCKSRNDAMVDTPDPNLIWIHKLDWVNKSPVPASFSHLDADSTIGSFSLIQNTWKQIRVYFPAIKENCSILFISNAQKLSLVSKVIGSAMVFILDGNSEHVTHMWRKIGLLLRNIFH